MARCVRVPGISAEGDGPPRAYADVPGLWPGIPYDVVTGEGDGGMPGLPDEVLGCLEGT